MKLCDFLSDKSKQALYDIRKSQSKETFDKIEEIRKKGKELASAKSKVVKRYSYKDSIINSIYINKDREEDIKKRLAVQEEEKKRLKKERKKIRKLERIKHEQEKEEERKKREIQMELNRQKEEVRKRAQNRVRVAHTYNGYQTTSNNSIKAWSIPMGGQNKRY